MQVLHLKNKIMEHLNKRIKVVNAISDLNNEFFFFFGKLLTINLKLNGSNYTIIFYFFLILNDINCKFQIWNVKMQIF